MLCDFQIMASKSGVKRKRVVLTMEKKLEAIQRLDMGETLKSISVEFGVGDSTVSDWKKNRKQIEEYCGRMACKEALRERKVVSRTKNDALDEALLLWINQERKKGVTITGPIIQEKALSLHKLMGGNEAFMASPGWLDRFKKRNGIRHLSLLSEKLSDGNEASKMFVSRLSSILNLENLVPKQVYTCGERDLSYRMLPARVLEVSNMDCKWYNERVTVMACSNAAGSHKLPLVVVGRTAKPQVCKSIDISSLPIVYKHQRTSCMNGKILKEWFFDNFVPLVKCRLKESSLPEKAVLVLDKHTSHLGVEELVTGDIRAIFFPHTVTSSIQPMNQGILRNIVLRYRHKLLSALLGNNLERSMQLLDILKDITIQDVLYMCVAAWDEIPRSVLVDSWDHCLPVQENVAKRDPATYDDEAELDIVSFVDMLHQLPDCEDIDEGEVRQWLAIDKDVMQQEITMNQNVVSAMTGGDDNESDTLPINHEDGVQFLELALLYVQQQPTTTPVDVVVLKRLRDQAIIRRNTAMSQKTIDHYFPHPLINKLLASSPRIRRTSGPN